MKKFKLSVLAMVLTTMLGFTSCLDSGEPGPSSATSFLKVRTSMGYTTFEDPSGFQYIPTTTLTTSPTSRLAFLYFEIDTSTLTQESTSADITLLQDPVYLREMNAALSPVPAEEETVALYGIPSNGCAVWGAFEFLIMAPNFNLKKGTTTSNLDSELPNHRLAVYYDSTEEGVANGTLRLHIRYRITNADMTDENWGQDYNVQYGEYVFVDLASIISAYRNNNQNEYPTRLELEYEMYNTNSATSDPDKKTSQTITIEKQYLPDMSETEE